MCASNRELSRPTCHRHRARDGEREREGSRPPARNASGMHAVGVRIKISITQLGKSHVELRDATLDTECRTCVSFALLFLDSSGSRQTETEGERERERERERKRDSKPRLPDGSDFTAQGGMREIARRMVRHAARCSRGLRAKILRSSGCCGGGRRR